MHFLMIDEWDGDPHVAPSFDKCGDDFEPKIIVCALRLCLRELHAIYRLPISPGKRCRRLLFGTSEASFERKGIERLRKTFETTKDRGKAAAGASGAELHRSGRRTLGRTISRRFLPSLASTDWRRALSSA